MADIYNYTDLQVTFVIDPEYCTGTIYAAFVPSSGIPVEVTTTDYNAVTGEVNVSLTQAQTANLQGIVGIQLNGFKDSKRWASEVCYVSVVDNLSGRVLE